MSDPRDEVGADAVQGTDSLGPRKPRSPKGRIRYLRDFLAALPDERFNIASYFSRISSRGRRAFTTWKTPSDAVSQHGCKTAACVAGWAGVILAPGVQHGLEERVGELLGLDWFDQAHLFRPAGYDYRPRRYTRAAAVKVLDIYLETGWIDWELAIRKTKEPDDGAREAASNCDASQAPGSAPK